MKNLKLRCEAVHCRWWQHDSHDDGIKRIAIPDSEEKTQHKRRACRPAVPWLAPPKVHATVPQVPQRQDQLPTQHQEVSGAPVTQ